MKVSYGQRGTRDAGFTMQTRRVSVGKRSAVRRPSKNAHIFLAGPSTSDTPAPTPEHPDPDGLSSARLPRPVDFPLGKS